MNSTQLREKFQKYFKEKAHVIVPGASLIPSNDPTLLFTNAGMVPFKEVFLGGEERPYTRATSVQRCLRAGGKHNDLENVGYTKRHHTFFEMLGNFSFGDYFKREAIAFAWEFLTKELNIPVERLWVTVYKDDKESEAIWLEEMKIDPERFSRCGKKDNFWSMGETGPCGPCTEIFYDHGPEIHGGPPGTPEEDGDRYVEIWNLVFMEYNRDHTGNLAPLPNKSVDTGMGLERIACVVQGVHDNYDTDIFQHLLKAIEGLTGCKDFTNTSMRVIADHIRSISFLIADGVTPSNEGRGYVLRRIIRRAIRHGFKLGVEQAFLHQLVPALVEIMGAAHPELARSQMLIEQVIEQEEKQFSKTLGKGLKILDEGILKLSGNEIPGEVVFQLYDTYGFPHDLTADIARERGLMIDEPGFQVCMKRQREQSQASAQFSMDQTQRLVIRGETEFTGYEALSGEGVVTTLLHDEKPVMKLEQGEQGIVVLDKTPFYAESGGQVGDAGYLYADGATFRVKDTKKKSKAYMHFGEVIKGTLKVEDGVRSEVDETRKETILNHSATHLLHEALRRVLGEHVTQKGSLVEPKRLRFDFAHPSPMTREQLHAVERLVNQQIRANLESTVKLGSLEEAQAEGAMALFGEKYDDEIRIVTMGEFSKEVCGGTHANRSGDIGLFKITQETGIAAGIRRIEAVTGPQALTYIESNDNIIRSLSNALKVSSDDILRKLEQTLAQTRQLEKELAKLKQQMAGQKSASLKEQAVDVGGIQVLAANMGAVDRDTLRSSLDRLKDQLGSKAAILLASEQDGKALLVSGLGKDCLAHFNATELLNAVAGKIGGKGGGRPDMAQGGGDDLSQLQAALDSVPAWVQSKME